jgi:hypothetical protein
MRRACVLVTLLLLSRLTASGAIADEPAAQPPQRILVPAYFYPSRDGMTAWKELLASANETPVVAIVNPASGPGRRADPNYEEVFRLAKSSKATLIGYVTLSYARRPAAEVYAEVDAWVKFYPGIQGIFFDEQPSGAARGIRQRVLCSRRRQDRQALIVSNPARGAPRVRRAAAEAGDCAV